MKNNSIALMYDFKKCDLRIIYGSDIKNMIGHTLVSYKGIFCLIPIAAAFIVDASFAL